MPLMTLGMLNYAANRSLSTEFFFQNFKAQEQKDWLFMGGKSAVLDDLAITVYMLLRYTLALFDSKI